MNTLKELFMANHYYDMTGVLRLGSVTPVIQALFGAFDLDATFPGEDEVYIANISERTTCRWNHVAERLYALVEQLGLATSVPLQDEANVPVLLTVLAQYYGVADHPDFKQDVSGQFEESEDADLEVLFNLARLFDDGHGLFALKTEGAWHSDRIKSFCFGGDGLYRGLHAGGYLSSTNILSLTEGMDGALTAGKVDEVVDMLAQHISRLLDGIGDPAVRDVVRKQLGARLQPAVEESVPVKHWDAYPIEGTVDTHRIELADQRKTSGQLYATVQALDGDEDDMLSLSAEVNTHPLDGIGHLPCMHIHFDDNALAVSLFKVGRRILVRPETDVRLEGFSHDFGSHQEGLMWLERIER